MKKRTYSKRRGNKDMTDQDFRQIKMLLEAKLRPKQIEEITHRSTGVIKIMRDVESFEEYVSTMRARNNAYILKKLAEKEQATQVQEVEVEESSNHVLPVVEEQATQVQEVEVEERKETSADVTAIVVQLQKINKTLRRLADAWEAQPKNKRFPIFS